MILNHKICLGKASGCGIDHAPKPIDPTIGIHWLIKVDYGAPKVSAAQQNTYYVPFETGDTCNTL